eukprot:5610412-Pyramimonas_sp.AAC.2
MTSPWGMPPTFGHPRGASGAGSVLSSKSFKDLNNSVPALVSKSGDVRPPMGPSKSRAVSELHTMAEEPAASKLEGESAPKGARVPRAGQLSCFVASADVPCDRFDVASPCFSPITRMSRHHHHE